jgi:hypothetical protein
MPSNEEVTKSRLTDTVDEVLNKKRRDKKESQQDIKFLNILEFIEVFKLLPYGLYPVQKFILKMYYNIPLDDILPDDETQRIKVPKSWDKISEAVFMTEVQYLAYLHSEGRCNVGVQNLARHRREIILVIGRRSGKSTLSSLCSAYELYRLLRRGHPQSFYGMPDGSEIRILCIANDKEQAQIVYQEMSGYIGQVDYFKNSIIHDTLSYMKFQTANDRKIFGEAILGKQGGKGTITATFKSSVARGLRGRGIICCTMDEIAFFEDSGVSSADEIHRAISPSLRQFSPKDAKKRFVPLGPSEARMILISSPNAKEGFFYRRYLISKSNDNASSNILMLQAPTWEVNPTLSPQDYEDEYYKSPSQFYTEFGAEFSDRVRGWIENHKDLTDCIDPLLRPLTRGIPRDPYFAGIDFGLIRDGTSIALTHLASGKIELGYHESWYAKKSWKDVNSHLEAPISDYSSKLLTEDRLDIEEIAKWLEALSKRFYIVKGVFDQWAGPIFEQHLHKVGLTQFEMRKFSTVDSSNMYQTLKMAMFDRRVNLYDWPEVQTPSGLETIKKMHSPLITELLELQATSGGKNIMIVEAPKITGKHDDSSDAVARSVLLASEYISANPGVLEATLTRGQNPLMKHRLGTNYHQFHRARTRLHGGAPKERRVARGRI